MLLVYLMLEFLRNCKSSTSESFCIILTLLHVLQCNNSFPSTQETYCTEMLQMELKNNPLPFVSTALSALLSILLLALLQLLTDLHVPEIASY